MIELSNKINNSLCTKSYYCFMKNIFLLVLIIQVLLVSCSNNVKKITSLETKKIINSTLEQALIDSIKISNTPIKADCKLSFVINQDDKKVNLEDHFILHKLSGKSYISTPLEQSVIGDSILLKDMYTFKDSKDRPREKQNSELSGMSFGAEVTKILRMLLSKDESTYCEIIQQKPAFFDTNIIVLNYTIDDGSGEIYLSKVDKRIVKLIQNLNKSYFFGSYNSQMIIDYTLLDSNLLVPTTTINNFTYKRMTSNGTGKINAKLNILK